MFNDGRSLANSRRLDILFAGLSGPASASGNPYLASWLNVLSPDRTTPQIESGVIVDVLPGGRAYRVSAGARSFLWCSDGGTTAGYGKIGARPLTTYAIGTPVWFIRHPQTPNIGTIIAAEPPWMLGSPEQWPADGIWPFIRSGQKSETSHIWPVWEDSRVADLGDVKLKNLDIVDFSAGRPIDATGAGEWGAMTETGLGVFMDSFQVYLRVDETTGVFGSYQDQMLLVAGHNFQFMSSHTEHEEFEDEGELAGFTRTCVYPWEAYGVWRHNQVTPGWAMSEIPRYGWASGQGTIPNDPIDVQAASGYAVREPEGAKALPAARIYDWSGYLGQGGKKQIAAPVQLSWAYPDVPSDARLSQVTADTDPENRVPGGRLLFEGAAGQLTKVGVVKDGAWDAANKVYTPADGAIAVTAGMWVSLYTTGQPHSSNGWIGQVKESSSGATIVFEDDVFQGDIPPSAASGVAAIVWAATIQYLVPVNERGDSADKRVQPGVFEEQKTLGGRFAMRAAGGIFFSKRSVIPSPKPNRKAADPAGDNPQNYDASGLNAAGAVTHNVTGDLAFPGGPAHRMAALPDTLAYLFNWEGLHPFVYHDRDWTVAEESDAGSTLVNQKAPSYADIEIEDYLAAPSPNYLDIDHRYGLVPVYENQSDFAMFEDGSIVLSDGWGSEIRMGGGNIEFHCVGDIRIFNGRDVIVWSGHDIALKAQNSMDLVAERADFRTHAGRNSQHLAGNRGCGGFLFQTNAVCPSYSFCGKLGEDVTGSGFVVLTPNSQVWMHGQDVVLSLEPTHPDGRIVLAAGQDREIHSTAKRFITRLPEGGTVAHLFGTAYANEFGGEYTIIGGKLYVTNGVRATTVAADATAAQRITYVSTVYAADFDATHFNPDGSECAEYSARTAKQYLSSKFTYWKSKWKVIAEGDDQELQLWDEEPVVGLRSYEVTRPHPGERWEAVGGQKSHSWLLSDPTDNWLAKSRLTYRTTYEFPDFASPGQLALSTGYKIPFLRSDGGPPTPIAPAEACGYTFETGAGESITVVVPDGPWAGVYVCDQVATEGISLRGTRVSDPLHECEIAFTTTAGWSLTFSDNSGPLPVIFANTSTCDPSFSAEFTGTLAGSDGPITAAETS